MHLDADEVDAQSTTNTHIFPQSVEIFIVHPVQTARTGRERISLFWLLKQSTLLQSWQQLFIHSPPNFREQWGSWKLQGPLIDWRRWLACGASAARFVSANMHTHTHTHPLPLILSMVTLRALWWQKLPIDSNDRSSINIIPDVVSKARGPICSLWAYGLQTMLLTG